MYCILCNRVLSARRYRLAGQCKQEPAKIQYQTAPGKTEKPDPGLSDPAFAALTPEVLRYLEDLLNAFHSQDRAYLLNQAEPYYRQTFANLYPEDEYLAMLYRIGSYSSDSGIGEIKKPLLDLNEVRGITYTGWDELGPVLEIRGTILLKNGKIEPCRLILLWRLGDIKIKGFEP